MTIYRDTTAIEAVNNGKDQPDAFYHKGTMIGVSKYVATDGWRGYTDVVPEPGFKEIEASWLTGDWDDAPSGHSDTEVADQIDKLEAEHGDIWVVYTPTSNVFSTSYTVIVRDPNAPPAPKGKTVGHKTKRFEQPNGAWSIRYHATHVISYDPDTQPHYTLNSGGWQTKTTKERINQYLPSGYYISQKNFEWTVHTPAGSVPFTDGMTV